MKRAKHYKIIDSVIGVFLENNIGTFLYDSYKLQDNDDKITEVVAIYNGEIKNGMNLRINSACYTGDIFGCNRCDCKQQLIESFKYIKINGGMVIYIFDHEGRGIGITNKLKTLKIMDYKKCSTYQAFIEGGFSPDIREYGQAIAILNYLNVHEVQLLTNNPDKKKYLESSGIKVLQTIPLIIKDKKIRKYLLSKEKEFNHVISKYIGDEE